MPGKISVEAGGCLPDAWDFYLVLRAKLSDFPRCAAQHQLDAPNPEVWLRGIRFMSSGLACSDHSPPQMPCPLARLDLMCRRPGSALSNSVEREVTR